MKLVKLKLKSDKLKFFIELLLGKDFYVIWKLNESMELLDSVYDDVVKFLFRFEFFVFVFENKVVEKFFILKWIEGFLVEEVVSLEEVEFEDVELRLE